MQLIRSRVLAVVAGALVVVGLGAGGAVAGSLITSADIKDGSVRKVDLHRDTVGPSELQPGGVRSVHLQDGLVRKRDLADWVQLQLFKRAEDGTDGTDGQAGEDGKDGVSGYEVIGRGTDTATGTGQPAKLTMQCVTGKVALGGGLMPYGDAGQVTVHGSYPSDVTEVTDPADRPETDPNGIWGAGSWSVDYTAAEGAGVQGYVLCADLAMGD